MDLVHGEKVDGSIKEVMFGTGNGLIVSWQSWVIQQSKFFFFFTFHVHIVLKQYGCFKGKEISQSLAS